VCVCVCVCVRARCACITSPAPVAAVEEQLQVLRGLFVQLNSEGGKSWVLFENLSCVLVDPAAPEPLEAAAALLDEVGGAAPADESPEALVAVLEGLGWVVNSAHPDIYTYVPLAAFVPRHFANQNEVDPHAVRYDAMRAIVVLCCVCCVVLCFVV